MNQITCTLRFIYKRTLGIKDAADHIPLVRQSDPLPAILSREEAGDFSGQSIMSSTERHSPTIYARACASPK